MSSQQPSEQNSKRSQRELSFQMTTETVRKQENSEVAIIGDILVIEREQGMYMNLSHWRGEETVASSWYALTGGAAQRKHNDWFLIKVALPQQHYCECRMSHEQMEYQTTRQPHDERTAALIHRPMR